MAASSHGWEPWPGSARATIVIRQIFFSPTEIWKTSPALKKPVAPDPPSSSMKAGSRSAKWFSTMNCAPSGLPISSSQV